MKTYKTGYLCYSMYRRMFQPRIVRWTRENGIVIFFVEETLALFGGCTLSDIGIDPIRGWNERTDNKENCWLLC